MGEDETRPQVVAHASSGEAESLLLAHLIKKVAAAADVTDLVALRSQAAEVFGLLIALRTFTGNTDRAVTATALESMIARGVLLRLSDDDGRSCAAEAVETLVSLGFPFALHVSPADVELRHQENLRVRNRKWLKWVKSGAIGVAIASLALRWFSPRGSWPRTSADFGLIAAMLMGSVSSVVDRLLRRQEPRPARPQLRG